MSLSASSRLPLLAHVSAFPPAGTIDSFLGVPGAFFISAYDKRPLALVCPAVSCVLLFLAVLFRVHAHRAVEYIVHQTRAGDNN